MRMEGATLEHESDERVAAAAALAARRERGVGVLMLIIASVLWSLSGVFVKTLKLPPITFTLYRSIGPVCGILSGIAFGGLALVLDKLDRVSGGGVNPALIVLFNNLGAIAVLVGIAVVGRQWVAPAWKAGIVMGVGVIQLAIPYV